MVLELGERCRQLPFKGGIGYEVLERKKKALYYSCIDCSSDIGRSHMGRPEKF